MKTALLVAVAGVLVMPCSLWAGEGVTLQRGQFYFQLGTHQNFLLGRNPTGWQFQQFDTLLTWAAQSGEKIVRVHLTTGVGQPSGPGQIDEAWATHWESVFDLAEKNGMYMLPVFGVWSDWNDGSKKETWHSWHKNPYSAELGGPAKSPAELFQDTACRKLYLQWLTALVARWQKRPCILGWEIFSELDLVTGSSEDAAVEFIESAAKVIRAADPQGRPVTASLAGVNEWPRLLNSAALDFNEIHPYADNLGGKLDELLISSVRQRLQRYGKPVFIGESGLDSRGPQMPLNVAPAAPIGLRHALWAAVVSGAMNGRMLWWEDGYDQYAKLDLRTPCKDLSAPVAQFVKGVDFSGFRPLDATVPKELSGAAIGHQTMVLAWFRDALCAPPQWPVEIVGEQTVILKVPGNAPDWTAQFYDTETANVVGKAPVRRSGESLALRLPEFKNSIAVKLSADAARAAQKR